MEYVTRFRIYPNADQQILIHQTFGCCRFAWNHYIAVRQFFYDNDIKDDNGRDIWTKFNSMQDLVFLKVEYPWLKDVDSIALQATIEDLDRAYQNLFRGCKSGKNVGYPKFKSKKNPKQSYRTKNGNGNKNIRIDYDKNRIKLPKLGWVKAKLSKQVSGRILNVTVSRNASGKYFVSVCWTDVIIQKLPSTGRSTGIDLGLTDLAVFSNGSKIDNRKSFKQNEKKLARAQRRLSRKQTDSKRYAKQQQCVAKIHEKISN